jgi:hypothetical protein
MDNMDQSNAVMPIAGTSSTGNAGMLQNVGMSGNAGIPTDDVLLVLPCSKEVSGGWE